MKSKIYRWVLSMLLLPLVSCQYIQSGEKAMQEEVAAINSECPKMIDSETSLEKVEVLPDKHIVYHFCLVNVYRQNVDTQLFRRNLWPGLLSAVRSSPELEDLREHRMQFDYIYLDKAKQLIYTFKIGPGQYLP